MASVVRWLCVALVAGLAFGRTAHAQDGGTGTITGRVTDSTSQQPIGSVTVSVVGTRVGGITRDDGTYTIVNVPAGNQRVRVTRIGYTARTQDVTIASGGTTTLNFTLNTVATQLNQVVVVGYGQQRREAVTGSVAQVDAEQARVGVVANADQMVQGRVAGVNIVTSGGEPGGNVQVRIRGGTSLSASNEPLYVIDGVPIQNEGAAPGGVGIGGINPALGRNPLNSLNPNDIESITVLKDASSTAIYGSRGANGVILIQTKRGTSRT